MLHITQSTIKSWERFYRANFINCLSGFKSATLIGTVKENGQPNLGLFSNVVHIGADPAIIGFINRPREAAPHTIANIERTNVYTMNLVPANFAAAAHASSAKYDLETDEFAAVGFTKEWQSNIDAPFVAESNIKYAMHLLEIVPITHNNTFLVLGTITDVFIAEQLIQQDGFITLDEANVLTTLGIDAYYTTTMLNRYQYAKPAVPVKSIV
jgi:flavin reductase (DIM6/NTAB) family NADH-FMN oxidoreductase RutF